MWNILAFKVLISTAWFNVGMPIKLILFSKTDFWQRSFQFRQNWFFNLAVITLKTVYDSKILKGLKLFPILETTVCVLVNIIYISINSFRRSAFITYWNWGFEIKNRSNSRPLVTWSNILFHEDHRALDRN